MDIDIIYNKDCIEVLKGLEDNSIDAIVTDPPYNLGFMGKKWDKTGVAFNIDLWKECLRVIKPGGNLLAFGGTRTYHRMVCAIEDAGFEIRDCIMWVYGSGFPKSLNIGKAIDKLQGNRREVAGKGRPMSSLGVMHDDKWESNSEYNETKGTSEWEGYGTGLKPAYEPIVLARKPISEKSVAENCLKWGVGGLNIDGCRIGFDKNEPDKRVSIKDSQKGASGNPFSSGNNDGTISTYKPQGRFPANFIHDDSQEVMELFPKPHGAGYKRPSELRETSQSIPFKGDIGTNYGRFGDSGSAARFFYCAKASKKERDSGCEELPEALGIRSNAPRENEEIKTKPTRNNHPTVKPLALMEYLVKLVTRPGHIVLDPFIGSGTTAMACVKLDRRYIGCELDKGNYDIAVKRIERKGIELS